MAKAKKVRKSKVVKTRNSGTLSESAFWSFIRSALRQKSRWWKPVSDCKQKVKRPYKGPNKRQKFEYQCNYCKNWFPDKEVNVDHIIPAGTLTCANDLPGFVERLFVEVEGLQVLCTTCHNKKTKQEKNAKTT
jgi:5-methylcytosine-specific restriction endonuclease McrA